MILHLVNQSPDRLDMGYISQFFSSDDKLLFIEDGTYHCISSAEPLSPASVHCFALAADVEARGLTHKIRPHIRLVSYEEFVDLCVETDKVKRWS